VRLSFLKTLALRIGKFVLTVFGLLAVLLLLFQNQLIYHPRANDADYRDRLPPRTVELKYTTSQGNQVCYFVPPKARSPAEPERIWVLFPGNASLALDWLTFISVAPRPSDAFLLIDYPGYGACEGSASAKSIEESAEQAVATLASALQTNREALDQRLNGLGLSIGCATALQFSVRHPIKELILVAPFTSLRDVARRVVGFPLCYLLRHNYDNLARLSELAARPAPPRVTVVHGTEDKTVPVRMGQELARLFPRMIEFHEIAGADHNTILGEGLPFIHAAMKR
jgi:pimeloyl-ACP methyl ester carboxylesterase